MIGMKMKLFVKSLKIEDLTATILILEKNEPIHKRWEILYNYKEFTSFNNVMKRHLNRMEFGDNALNSAHEMGD
jgi:hypothetical protein